MTVTLAYVESNGDYPWVVICQRGGVRLWFTYRERAQAVARIDRGFIFA